MRMNEGVEWAAHVCLLLHWWQEDAGSAPVPVAQLAAAHELPPPYLGKQIQALTRAGITESVPGKKGGVRLSRPADRITLMDVVAAIEGPGDAFLCTEIRRNGINRDVPAAAFSGPCQIATAMRRAELAWRRTLAATTIADLAVEVGAGAGSRVRSHFQRTNVDV